jgi:hypothetical protein
MKNSDCYQILTGLNEIKQIPFTELSDLGTDKIKYIFHTDFVMACSRNKKMITEYLTLLEEIKKPTEEFNKYQEERREIAKEYAKKDANGNPETVVRPIGNGQMFESYIIPNINDKGNLYNVRLAALEKVNEKVIKDQKGKEEQFEKALSVECDLKLHKIKESLIPMGISSITAGEALLWMIEEPVKQKETLKEKVKKN